jgi:hypothetical protein
MKKLLVVAIVSWFVNADLGNTDLTGAFLDGTILKDAIAITQLRLNLRSNFLKAQFWRKLALGLNPLDISFWNPPVQSPR